MTDAPPVFCALAPPEVPGRWGDTPDTFDVAVIGAGPAGLSAAINASAEGLRTVLLSATMGGQAGSSSRIENFLGFPRGISGPVLTGRALKQARKFGTTVRNCMVGDVSEDRGIFRTTTWGEDVTLARSVIVAAGAKYNQLDPATDVARFEGKGIHHSAVWRDLPDCGKRAVVVIGGGNSAGQAALFLAEHIEAVHLVVRRGNLNATMSAYLIGRIIRHPRIRLHHNCEITRIVGTRRVEGIHLTNGDLIRVSDLFVMIGAKPHTEFLEGLCGMDDHGFIITDPIMRSATPGLFAVGDVRSGSVKRVPNAVGEGAAVVPHVWAYLKEGAVCPS